MKSLTLRRVLAIASAVVILLPLAAIADDSPIRRFPQEVAATEFSSSFGDGRSGGRRHHGNDLMAPKMTEVYAAAPGKVVTITTARGAGRYIVIDHAHGWSTAYMHLNNDNLGTDDGRADWSLTLAAGIEVGAWVRAGQLIGWVGDSGNAERTGSHTHFELRRDGRAVDPYRWLQEAHQRDQIALVSDFWEFLERVDVAVI